MSLRYTDHYRLGKRTLRNLRGVHPDIVRAVKLAIRLTRQDFCILDGGGLRTPAQAQANARRGVGVVTSLHLPQADGWSHAVDLVAYVNGRPSWDRKYYREIRRAMLAACDHIGLLIQHGADWDIDGILGERGEWDWPHFQKPNKANRIAAAALALAMRMEKS